MTDSSEASVAPVSSFTPPRQTARSVPRSVIIASWLWAIPVLALVAVLVYVGFMVAQAASIGGPAWDYPIFIGAPLALISIVLLAVQVPCALRLRRASRAARIALLAVAIPTAALAILWTRPDPGSPSWISLLGIIDAAAVVAAVVLSFTPSANQFFRKRPPSPADADEAITAQH